MLFFPLQDYKMTLYLRQVWEDPRLVYDMYNKTIVLSYKQYDKLWVPDLFIKNEKTGISHKITVANMLIRVSPQGQVLLSQRYEPKSRRTFNVSWRTFDVA